MHVFHTDTHIYIHWPVRSPIYTFLMSESLVLRSHIHIDRQTDRPFTQTHIYVDIETLNSLKLLFFSSLFPADENEMLILNVIR